MCITIFGYFSVGPEKGKVLIKKYLTSVEVIITFIPVLNTLFLLICIGLAIRSVHEKE